MTVGANGENRRDLALSAPHARSRERFVALHEIARGDCASAVAERTGRHPQSVMDGCTATTKTAPRRCRSGHRGRAPFAPRSKPRSVRRFAPPSETRPGRP